MSTIYPVLWIHAKSTDQLSSSETESMNCKIHGDTFVIMSATNNRDGNFLKNRLQLVLPHTNSHRVVIIALIDPRSSSKGSPIVLVTDYSGTLEAGSLCNRKKKLVTPYFFLSKCIVPCHDHQFVRRATSSFERTVRPCVTCLPGGKLFSHLHG